LRSFFDPETQLSRCIYLADAMADILQHARAAGLPCDRIRPLVEVWQTAAGKLERGNSEDGTPLRDDSGTLALWMARHRLSNDSKGGLHLALESAWSAGEEAWVRSYIDREAAELISIYRAASEESAQIQAARLDLALVELKLMQENVPADFLTAEAPAAAN
jgi:hypothetical protein